MSQLTELKAALRVVSTPEKAKSAAWFFKTGSGQCGEGDQFIGVTVPEQRIVAKRFGDLPLVDVEALIQSPIHEERLTGLTILVNQFKRADDTTREKIYQFYLSHTDCVNNWDLVDSSAGFIVGEYLRDKDDSVLNKLAESESLWERRIAMIATFEGIKRGEPTKAIEIADTLLYDQHDLIQKAVGWMLREIGKRCGQEVEEGFLRSRYKTMPRTMLRYAIERFEPELRQAYLMGEV